MRKEKLTPEQKEERLARARAIVIETGAWILGICFVAMLTTTCVFAVIMIVKNIMEVL